MRVCTTHRQRLRGKRNCWNRILDRWRGASLRESLHGTRRGSRRSGNMAIPVACSWCASTPAAPCWGGPLCPSPASMASHCWIVRPIRRPVAVLLLPLSTIPHLLGQGQCCPPRSRLLFSLEVPSASTRQNTGEVCTCFQVRWQF